MCKSAEGRLPLVSISQGSHISYHIMSGQAHRHFPSGVLHAPELRCDASRGERPGRAGGPCRAAAFPTFAESLRTSRIVSDSSLSGPADLFGVAPRHAAGRARGRPQPVRSGASGPAVTRSRAAGVPSPPARRQARRCPGRAPRASGARRRAIRRPLCGGRAGRAAQVVSSGGGGGGRGVGGRGRAGGATAKRMRQEGCIDGRLVHRGAWNTPRALGTLRNLVHRVRLVHTETRGDMRSGDDPDHRLSAGSLAPPTALAATGPRLEAHWGRASGRHAATAARRRRGPRRAPGPGR